MIGLFFALVFAQPTPAAPFGTYIDEGGNEWTALQAPAVDITDYYVLSRDLAAATERSLMREPGANRRQLWLLSNEVRNRAVRYRTARTRIIVDCTERTMAVTYFISYRADGSIYQTEPRYGAEGPIVPGTVAESWLPIICR